MKQLLLRVPEELHAKLTAQAKAKGVSLNALANDVLGLGIDPTVPSERDRLQLKLMSIGVLKRGANARPVGELLPRLTTAEWEKRLTAAKAEIGPKDWIDDLIDDERGDR